MFAWELIALLDYCLIVVMGALSLLVLVLIVVNVLG